jgi:CRP-like cAMP-binding protein
VEGVIEIPLGNDTVIQIARPGSVIGEIAVFLNLASRIPNVKRTADCICATTVKAIVLDLDQVEPYLGEHPQLLTDLLIAMTERTKETHSLIAMARNRLREKLFSRLNLPLLGFNQLAHALESYSTNLAFAKPFTFCAYQARQIFNRFKESLAILDSPV